MAYNDSLTRANVAGTIPEDFAKEVISAATGKSAALTLMRRVPMAKNQQRRPVVSALPQAFFVNGETGQKQTTNMAWENIYLNTEELAAIVPIPESVAADLDFDIWGEAKPLIAEAIGVAIDNAVFFGTNKPSTWSVAIGPAAVAAGNYIARGTNATAAGGLAGDISDAFAKVENDGFVVSGAVANPTYKGLIRQNRSTLGEQLRDLSMTSAYGVPIEYSNATWPATGTNDIEFLAGEFDKYSVIGVRQDITYKMLTESVLQDNTGAIIFNLAQQDMVALRVVFRCAFATANPITRLNSNSSTRYPFSVIRNN